jgi:hypothetical protein
LHTNDKLLEELENLKDKFCEIKDAVEQLVYLWDTGSLYPDGERVVNEIKELVEETDTAI